MLRPFSQAPAIETEALKLFESGAMVFHIVEWAEALMTSDETRRVRTSPWTVTALNLVEPATDTLAGLDLFHAGEPWALARRPIVVEAVQERLVALLEWLDGRDHLEEVHHGGSADDHRPPHSAA